MLEDVNSSQVFHCNTEQNLLIPDFNCTAFSASLQRTSTLRSIVTA